LLIKKLKNLTLMVFSHMLEKLLLFGFKVTKLAPNFPLPTPPLMIFYRTIGNLISAGERTLDCNGADHPLGEDVGLDFEGGWLAVGTLFVREEEYTRRTEDFVAADTRLGFQRKAQADGT
jgi:hypothetical protein